MGKKRIMVIDDEEVLLEMVKPILEWKGGYEVMTLSNAKDIIYKVKNFMPDIILLDLIMPLVCGEDVCRMLEDDPIGKDIPIIIFSSLEEDAQRLKKERKKVVDYILKPARIETIILRIEKILSYK